MNRMKSLAKGIWRFVSYLFWPQLHHRAVGWLLTHLTDYTAYLPTAHLHREFAHNASDICIKHQTFA